MFFLAYLTLLSFMIVLIVLVGIAVRDWCCNLGMRSDPNLQEQDGITPSTFDGFLCLQNMPPDNEYWFLPGARMLESRS